MTPALVEQIRAAELALQAGRFPEAENACRQVLNAQPDNPPATRILGIVAWRKGQKDLSLDLLRKALALEPHSAVAKSTLATVLKDCGNTEEATRLFEEAIQQNPDNPITLSNLSSCYLEKGQYQQSLDCLDLAIKLNPKHPAFHHNRALALQGLGRDAEAATSLRQAIVLDAKSVRSLTVLARLYSKLGQTPEVVTYAKAALRIDPRIVEAHLLLAQAFIELRQQDQAERHLNLAVVLDPQSSLENRMLGFTMQQFGMFEDAVERFTRSIDAQPSQGFAYYGIVQSKKIGERDRPLVQRMIAVSEEVTLPPGDRQDLHYAIGKSLDDLGDFEAAMSHYDKANNLALQLRNDGKAVNRNTYIEGYDGLIQTFTKEFFEQNRAMGCDSETPLFVVGMMRSGTTLVEQIISSHPEVSAGDEIAFWLERGLSTVGDANGTPYPEGTKSPPSKANHGQVQHLAKSYLELLKAGPNVRRVTDKTPANFVVLGPIHLTFPNARIIHVRRNPVDNCLSIYTTRYQNSPDFAHNRENIVFAYRQHLRLMDHWRSVLPAKRFLEVNYEDLVSDAEMVSRRIVTFCGLDWNDSCLRHESNKRTISTPSLWQARQPVFNSSVSRWRKYEPWLGEFAELVND